MGLLIWSRLPPVHKGGRPLTSSHAKAGKYFTWQGTQVHAQIATKLEINMMNAQIIFTVFLLFTNPRQEVCRWATILQLGMAI